MGRMIRSFAAPEHRSCSPLAGDTIPNAWNVVDEATVRPRSGHVPGCPAGAGEARSSGLLAQSLDQASDPTDLWHADHYHQSTRVWRSPSAASRAPNDCLNSVDCLNFVQNVPHHAMIR
jgi:hypothetical protein